MLRASAGAFGYDLDLRSLADPSIPTGIPGGNELLLFVDAVLLGGDTDAARQAVVDALDGPSLVDAASVLGNFEMMNRVAEGSGIPIAQQVIDRNTELIETLGIGHFVKH
jgi:hypothetical protein